MTAREPWVGSAVLLVVLALLFGQAHLHSSGDHAPAALTSASTCRDFMHAKQAARVAFARREGRRLGGRVPQADIAAYRIGIMCRPGSGWSPSTTLANIERELP